MRRPRLRKLIQFSLLGMLATAGLPMVLTVTMDLTAGPYQTMSASTGAGQWTVTRWDRAGGVRLLSHHEKGRNWSVSQATGAPDTPTGGDQVTAWASASGDGSREWITLDFATAVVPKAVHVYEMCSTGAIDRVSLFNGDAEVTGWSGFDPLPMRQSMGTADFPVDGTFRTSRVKLYINSPAVGSWNEIDAVGLEDVNGKIQWAISAEASSEYGSGSYGPTNPGIVAAAMPAWSGLREVEFRRNGVPPATEETIIEARGWPMVSMIRQRRVDSAPATSSSALPVLIEDDLSNLSLTDDPSSGSQPPLQTTLVSRRSPYSGSTASVTTPVVTHPRVFPTRIIPLGFAVDSLLYTLVFGTLAWIASAPRRFFREAARVRAGHCVACGYNLRYDFVPGCPECGWNREDVGMEPSRQTELKTSAFTVDL